MPGFAFEILFGSSRKVQTGSFAQMVVREIFRREMITFSRPHPFREFPFKDFLFSVPKSASFATLRLRQSRLIRTKSDRHATRNDQNLFVSFFYLNLNCNSLIFSIFSEDLLLLFFCKNNYPETSQMSLKTFREKIN